MQKEEQNETKLCKYCQTEIPKKAKICPNCKKKQGGILKWVIAGIVAICIIGAIAGGGGDKPQKVGDKGTDEEKNVSSSQTDVSDNKEKETVFRKGEVAELNGVQVTLTDYKESEGGDFNKPSDGNVFVLAEFEISNGTDSEIAVSSMMSFEAYADDYSLNYSISAIMDGGNQLDGTVAAGKKMKGWIGWEVPTDYQNVEIHFTDNVWSNNKFVFLIEK